MRLAYVSVDPRTLPHRVAPIKGEALDSWMERLAAQHGVPLGDVLALCGLPYQASIPAWIAKLTADQLGRIAAVSGVEPDVIAAMTLARYSGCLVGARQHVRRLLWIRQASSRMCRRCLGDNDGRWQLAWRLNWSFVCVHHSCVLVDTCSRCGRPQRRHPPPPRAIPRPGLCAQSSHRPLTHGTEQCRAHLADGDVVSVAEAHQLLRAQGYIDDLLAGRSTHLGLYGKRPPAPQQVLADTYFIARWIISSVTREAAACCLPPEFGAAFSGGSAEPSHFTRQSSVANPSVYQAAAGISIALQVLAEPSVSSAAELLCALMTADTNGTCGVGGIRVSRLSAVVRASHDAAYASAQAQHRTLRRLAHSAARARQAPAQPGQRWTR